jgi:hypothetical protein
LEWSEISKEFHSSLGAISKLPQFLIVFDIHLTNDPDKAVEVIQVCSPICKPTIVAFHALD